MKRILSQTIALVYGAGLSVAVASSSFNEQLEIGFRAPVRGSQPVLLDGTYPLVNLSEGPAFDKAAMEGRTVLRYIPPEITANGGASTPATRLALATIDLQTQQEIGLSKIRKIGQEYDTAKEALEKDRRELEKQLDAKQKTLSQYDEYLSTKLEGKTVYTQTAFLEGKLSLLREQPIESQDQQQIRQITEALELLKKDRTQLTADIKNAKSNLDDINFKLENLQVQALQTAFNEITYLVRLKIDLPVILKELNIFDHDTLATRGEVRLALIEMGVHKSFANNHEVVKAFLSAAAPNLLWPVFSIPFSGQSDIPSGRYDFLKELQSRAEVVKSKLQYNLEKNIKGTAALLTLMELQKVPVTLKIKPDALYTHITTNITKQEPDQSNSLHFQSFLEEELYSKFKMSKQLLQDQLKPTHQVAMQLLTGAIMGNLTATQQISAREFPAQEATDAILLTLGTDQEPNPKGINKHLRKSLHEITVGRFNLLLVDNILARLSSITTESTVYYATGE